MTDFLIPWIVNSPSIFVGLFSFVTVFLDTNVSLGNFSTSKNSGLFKCLSRSASFVSIDEASISTGGGGFQRDHFGQFGGPMGATDGGFRGTTL